MATLPPSAAERKAPEDHELSPTNFPELKNDLMLRAARREPVEHVPVWVMRQAGRYLPEFLAASEGIDFFTRCQTPEIACQLTLQPIVRFPLDAAIIFSDILVIPQAVGLECLMVPGQGPVFPNPISSPEDLARLKKNVDVQEALGYVFKAITLTRHRLQGHVPLIGFAGAPWTLFAYMIEGKSSKTWDKAKTFLYKYPEASHEIFDIVTDATIAYLVGQVRSGAQLLQVFDSWAGSLSRDLFREFCLPSLAKIASGVKTALGADAVPMICFAKGAAWAMKDLESTDYDVQALDETADPVEIRSILKDKVAVQGNLDPCVMFAPDDVIERKVAAMMSQFGTVGHIANLGHGMSPTMEPRCVAAFVAAVHKFGSQQRTIRIGTRSSVLAMWQARYVLDKLCADFPTTRFTLVPMSSLGDNNLTLDLNKFSQTGVFTDLLEKALLSNDVDLIVHSLKDLPSTIHADTVLAAVGPREDHRDVVVFNRKHLPLADLSQLPPGSVIGTSSTRRRAQLAALYPSLTFKAVRGNVMTRLRKLDDDSNGYDALCLAAAGLLRLGLGERIHFALPLDSFYHAIGQGALGLQVRKDDNVADMCHKAVNHAETELVCKAERAFLRNVGGGCSLPIGVRSTREGSQLQMSALISSSDGKQRAEAHIEGSAASVEEAEKLGLELCKKVLAEGGTSILEELRKEQDLSKEAAN